MKAINKSPTDTDAVVQAVDDLVGALSRKLENLSRITELVAFACEARRTLADIDDQIFYFPDFGKHLHEIDCAYKNWMQFKDATGEVLRTVSQQIDQCNTELNDGTLCVHGLRSASRKAKT